MHGKLSKPGEYKPQRMLSSLGDDFVVIKVTANNLVAITVSRAQRRMRIRKLVQVWKRNSHMDDFVLQVELPLADIEENFRYLTQIYGRI